MKKGYVYILANKRNSTLYVGVSNNLENRIYSHKNDLLKGFTCKYKIKKLVYYEEYNSIYESIMREKQLKAGNRKRKIELIEKNNPTWEDLVKNWF